MFQLSATACTVLQQGRCLFEDHVSVHSLCTAYTATLVSHPPRGRVVPVPAHRSDVDFGPWRFPLCGTIFFPSSSPHGGSCRTFLAFAASAAADSPLPGLRPGPLFLSFAVPGAPVVGWRLAVT